MRKQGLSYQNAPNHSEKMVHNHFKMKPLSSFQNEGFAYVIAKVDSITFDYYEVECGTHNQAEFNAKCNKLRSITRNITIISKNRDIMTRILVPQIERWIKSVGIDLLRSGDYQLLGEEK